MVTLKLDRAIRVGLTAFIGAASLCSPAFAQSFTLEEIMSSPFPSSLVAAPKEGKVAWVFLAEGVRNIWVASPPDYRGQPVTRFTEDDGQEISDLGWTADARTLVFVRGGNANRQGEYPNPRSVTENIQQAIWVLTLDGSEPRPLAEGRAPAVSPHGDGVAFLRKDQVWWAPLSGTEKARQLIRARGSASSLRWSPDGSSLALVSSRGDHSFIGLYDLQSRTLRFLDPSVDRDGQPIWSPDGKRIAFLRQPASRTFFSFGPERSAEPWSIRVADAASGSSRQIFVADRGRGSAFHGIVAENQLLWAADDRVVFPWEKEGWVHLYAVPAGGGPPVLLTPGAFEVEHVALGTDGKTVVFASNQDDIDRRHLWSVPVSGGRPAALTSGKGIEWSPAPASDGKIVAFLRSDARRPAHPAIRLESGETRELAPGAIPAKFPEAALVEPEPVVFSAADGMRIHGQLFLPKPTGTAGRRPAVVFFHGGSRRQMLLGWHYMDYYHNSYALNQYLASRGYVVLSVNYRSGIGYGLEFREAENYGAHGASEFNDVLGAGLYLQSRPDVDPKRIGLWGGSYGGYLTALGLARASDLFSAGVDIHGVHDWNVVIRNFTPSYDPQKNLEMARRAYESSPMASVAQWRSPVLLIHGDDDRNVPFSETVDLVEALRKQGVEFEQLVFPDEVHDFLLHENWLRAFRAAADFFGRRLAGKKTPTQ